MGSSFLRNYMIVFSRISQGAFFLFLTVSLFFTTGLRPVSVRAQSTSEIEGREEEVLEHPVFAPFDSGEYSIFNRLPESIRKMKPLARALDEFTRQAGTSGIIDGDARWNAFEQAKADLLKSANIAMKGTPSKPLISTAWTNSGLIGSGIPSGGCTSAIAIDPKNTNIIYAGATAGGMWKTTDAGSSWISLTDLLIPNQSIASISIDPVTTSTIYIGTGYGFAGIDELKGTGMYKSTDAGSTWTRISSSAFTTTTTTLKVLVHPLQPNIVFASNYNGAAATKGLWRSIDYGATWTHVVTPAQPIWDIVPGATIGGVTILYYVEGNNVGESVSGECGVYKSVNDGASWTKISTTSLPSGSLIGRSALACPTGAANRVFALFSNIDGDTLGLYRSVDNGGSWTVLPLKETSGDDARGFLNAGAGAQGWYDLTLGVSPNSKTHDTILIGGVEAHVNFSDGSGWYNFSGYNVNGGPHVDHHAVAFDPKDPTIIYVGTDGGIYRSIDAGQSWALRSTNMITGRFYHVGLDRNDDRNTWAGAQDQGTWKMTSGASPSVRLGGDGFQAIVSPASSNTVYGELPQGELYKTTNGTNFGQIGAAYFNDTNNPPWNTPFKMSPLTSNTLYCGRAKVWRTTDAGASWAPISAAYSNQVSALGVSQVSSLILWAGTYGSISRTTNGGTNWTSSTGNPTAATATCIVSNWQNPAFALASFYTAGTGRVVVSSDTGHSWTDASGGTGAALPAAGVNCLAIDSVHPFTTWYAGTDNGVYYTTDAGSHWVIAGGGVGLVTVRDVQLGANKTTLRIATFGRGIWEVNANTLPVELSSLTAIPGASGTRLEWHTDSEIDNAGFYVERSIDGAAFEDLGFVTGLGSSNTRHFYSYSDPSTKPGDYLYQLKQVDLNGTTHYSNHVEVHFGPDIKPVLFQNYPNPFLLGTAPQPAPLYSIFGDDGGLEPSAVTHLKYYLPTPDEVTLKIFNSAGMLTRTLIDHQTIDAGEHGLDWDGRSNEGSQAGGGAYFLVMELASGYRSTVKMLQMSYQ